MLFVGIIPARGGSKGIPRKNLADCGGRSLLEWAARSALRSDRLPEVYLSTDDEEIAKSGRALGLQVPGLRPAEIASDTTPMISVMQHTAAWYERQDRVVDAFVLLQPTSPLRTASHVREAVDLYQEHQPESLVSVMRVPHQFTPGSLLRMEQNTVSPWDSNAAAPTRRQEKPKLYGRNGPAILIVGRKVLERGLLYGEPTLGYEMNALDSVDVDSPEDLVLASILIENRDRLNRRNDE
jgi:CMP-N,N'-diacetyllegionaminic acid synthase